MCRKFFSIYRQRFDVLASEFKRKELERKRNIISVTSGNADEERDRFLRERERIANVYDQDELKNRIKDARRNIWYLSTLSKGDVTKYAMIRKVEFLDAVNMLINQVKYQ